MVRSILQLTGVLGLIVLIFVAFPRAQNAPVLPVQNSTSEVVVLEVVPVQMAHEEPAPEVQTPPVETQPAAAAQSQESGGNEARRIQNPYTSAAYTENEVDALTRPALVNIYCESSRFGSVSGSGVIIDPRGVVLTNAHVAQYLLISSDERIALNCSIRTGSPAAERYTANILYFPASWVADHAKDVITSRPTGTGENDYALLVIRKSVDGTPLPSPFPYIPFDDREAIAFTRDSVLLAGYPAEFSSDGATKTALYPVTVFTRIGRLLTFTGVNVDTVSLGRVFLAQSGSSGGAVVNLWGHLVGIISTTSDGATTAERDLHALTLSYISRDLIEDTGHDLTGLLAQNVSAAAAEFTVNKAPALAKQITSFLP